MEDNNVKEKKHFFHKKEKKAERGLWTDVCSSFFAMKYPQRVFLKICSYTT